jgi:hypothetical protein
MAPLNAAGHAASPNAGGVSVVHPVGSGATMVRAATIAPRPVNAATSTHAVRAKVSFSPPTSARHLSSLSYTMMIQVLVP